MRDPNLATADILALFDGPSVNSPLRIGIGISGRVGAVMRWMDMPRRGRQTDRRDRR